jgi:hypothetical protein
MKTNINKPINNITRFNGKQPNLSETYFILLNDPIQDVTMVVRYVLFNGRETANQLAEVWVWFRDKKQNKEIALRQKNPLNSAKIAKDIFHLEIGNSGITDDKAWGILNTDTDNISWELTLHKENAIGIDRFPGLIKYTPFPKFYSPYCKHQLSGQVKFNGQMYLFNHVNASDGHYWGAKKALSWNWGNCVNFKEDPHFLFEGISVHANPKLPPALWMFFHWNNKIYNCSGILHSMLRNKETHSELNDWQFTATSGDIMFHGKMHASPTDMIMHSHPLPDNKFLYTTITLNADLEITVAKKTKNGQQILQTLTAINTASFEVTRHYRNMQVAREYQVIEKI